MLPSFKQVLPSDTAVSASVRASSNLSSDFQSAVVTQGEGSSSGSASKAMVEDTATTVHNETKHTNKIAFRSFEADDIALFIRVGERTFLAFNDHCPHYYVSEESVHGIGTCKVNGTPEEIEVAFILGRIIFIEDFEAQAHRNPYGLTQGSEYHQCTVVLLPEQVDPGEEGCSQCGSEGGFDGVGGGQQLQQKISCESFGVHDLALFFETGRSNCFLAFNRKCPHYYLSMESINSATSSAPGGPPAYIFGEVVLIDEQVASEDSNPYSLRAGTTFFVVTVSMQGVG